MDTKSAFHAFAAFVQRELRSYSQPPPSSPVRRVFVGFRKLAETCESSGDFRALVKSCQSEFGIRGEWTVRMTLRRAGIYQRLADDEPSEAIWSATQAYLQPRTVPTLLLILLDGAWFSVPSFSLCGFEVRRYSEEEIQGFGARPDVCQAFFSDEQLPAKWLAQQFFLVKENPPKTMRPASIWVQTSDALALAWRPLLALGLYRLQHFALPIVLRVEPGWQVQRLAWAEPWWEDLSDIEGAVTVPRVLYRVGHADQARFEDFGHFMQNALGARALEPHQHLIQRAARRYLRAMLLAGDGRLVSTDGFEDALLQYVFALEALLLPSERREESIADKLASRSAYLIAFDDDERERVFQQVKAVYSLRSQVVHGSKEPKAGKCLPREPFEQLWFTRDVVRRVFVSLLAFGATSPSEDWHQSLSTIHLQRQLQDRVAASARKVFELLPPATGPLEG